MASWLMKTEPDTFSLEHLRRAPGGIAPWDGVRNYQARNMLRDQVQLGDRVFIYHSSCLPAGIVGLAEVVRAGYPDLTAQDPASPAYDPRASASDPRWYQVDVAYREGFARMLTLAELRGYAALADFALLRKGQRLSVMPVPEDISHYLLALARRGQEVGL